MPVYNAKAYVRQAVESILTQTFGDFEFIIIDDGSTDESPAILRELAKKDLRIHLTSRLNTGYAKALNEALQQARGQYIARMDADDIAMPDRFEKQVAYLRQHPQVVLVGSRILMIDPLGTPLHTPEHKLTHDEIQQQLLEGSGWAVVHPAAMMVREQVMALGGYRTELEPSEDLDLFLRLTERGQAANLSDVLLHYRQHPKSVNHTRFEQQNRNKRIIITEAYARRGLELPVDWTPPRRNIMPPRAELNMWAWSALKKGHIKAARQHALALMKMAPLSPASWRLMYCALRGR
jgi:glycosyltransferase involved in cell wall biosynthesis